MLALACLTRYEAWPITAAAIACAFLLTLRADGDLRAATATAARVAVFPVLGILWFFVHSKATVGAWFVTDGFYVADPMYKSRPIDSLGAVWWGTRRLGSEALAWAALASALVLVVSWWRGLVPNAADRRAGVARRRRRCPSMRSTKGIPCASATWCRQ